MSDSARIAARNSLLRDRALLEADDSVRVDLGLRWPRFQLDMEYAPRLSLIKELDPNQWTPTLLHNGQARATYTVPRLRVDLTQSVALGEQGYVDLVAASRSEPLPGTGPADPSRPGALATAPRFDLVPGARAVSIAAEQTAGKVYWWWSPRWWSELRTSYGFSGGRDHEAQQLLPRQDTVDAGLNLAHAQSEHSRVNVGITWSSIWTSSDYHYNIASLTAGWSIDLAPRSNLSLSVGSARQGSRYADGTRLEAWLPSAAGIFTQRLTVGRASYLGIVGRADCGPYVNVLLGKLQNRVGGALGLELQQRRLTASTGATFTQTVPVHERDATRSFGGTASLQLGLSDRVGALAGVQLAKQSILQEQVPTHWLWIAYLGLTVQASPLAF